MRLREIQTEYNNLCPIARLRGIDVQEWRQVPSTRAHGMLRLNELRMRLGMQPIGEVIEVRHDAGANLSLRGIVEEWNRLVPIAHAQGIHANLWTSLPHTARRGMERLARLRLQLGQTTATTPAAQIVAQIDGDIFAGLTFGVEIECILPNNLRAADIGRLISAAGVPCMAEVYNHGVRNHWKIVTDASLMDGRGVELVSPVLSGENGFTQLRKVCQILVANQVRVSKRCGFHVHVGAAGQAPSFFANLVRLYQKYEPVIDAFMAPSRRQNPFCQATRFNLQSLTAATSINDVVRACGQRVCDEPRHARSFERYRKINLQSFYQHKTVEFRQHQGTIEASKAEMWVRFCLRMVMKAKQFINWSDLDGNYNGLDGMANMIALPADEVEFFRSRTIHFQRQESNRIAASVRRRRMTPMVISDAPIGSILGERQ